MTLVPWGDLCLAQCEGVGEAYFEQGCPRSDGGGPLHLPVVTDKHGHRAVGDKAVRDEKREMYRKSFL